MSGIKELVHRGCNQVLLGATDFLFVPEEKG